MTRRDLAAAEERFDREHSRPFTATNLGGIAVTVAMMGAGGIAVLRWLVGFVQ